MCVCVCGKKSVVLNLLSCADVIMNIDGAVAVDSDSFLKQRKSRLKIGNIKASFTTSKILFPNQVYYDSFKISIFKSCISHINTKVNATGIRNIKEISVVKEIIEDIFDCYVYSQKIDSIFLSQKKELLFNIEDILEKCKIFDKFYQIYYSPEEFCGIYLSPMVKPNNSFNLFVTGSATIMGAQSYSDINRAEIMLDYIYSCPFLQN